MCPFFCFCFVYFLTYGGENRARVCLRGLVLRHARSVRGLRVVVAWFCLLYIHAQVVSGD